METPIPEEANKDKGNENEVPQSKNMEFQESPIYQFALQLVEEFLQRSELHDALESLKKNLDKFNIQHPETNGWFEMFEECKLRFITKSISEKSVLEWIITYFIDEFNPRQKFSFDTNSSIKVISSPKKSIEGDKRKQSHLSLSSAAKTCPIIRPSERHPPVKFPRIYPVESSDNRNQPADNPHDKLSSLPQEMIKKRMKKTTSEPNLKFKAKEKLTKTYGCYNSPSSRSNVLNILSVETTNKDPKSELHREFVQSELLRREMIHLQTENEVKKANNSYSKKHFQRTLDESKTQRIIETLGAKKRKHCALCQQVYLFANLPVKVPLNSIISLYRNWNFKPKDFESAKYRPPLCYDKVSICLFCSQIVEENTFKEINFSFNQKPKEVEIEIMDPASDPFILPPIIGDDCNDEPAPKVKAYGVEVVKSPLRNSEKEELTTGIIGKTMIYSRQDLVCSQAMNIHEWDIITKADSSKSIRSVLSRSIQESKGK